MSANKENVAYKYNTPYPVNIEQVIPEFLPVLVQTQQIAATFEWRDDDIVICTYPRSGTHMAWLMTRMILQGSGEPIKDMLEESYFPSPDINPDQKRRRVFVSHSLPCELGQSVTHGGHRRFMVINRNPKDVAVSQYNMIKNQLPISVDIPETFQDFLQKRFFGNNGNPLLGYGWAKFIKAWEEFGERNSDVPLLTFSYEDVVQDYGKTIREIAKFVGATLTEDAFNDICAMSVFGKMKDIGMSGNSVTAKFWKGKRTFCRAGLIGDWKKTFTVAQNEKFDVEYKKWLEDSKLSFKFEPRY